MAGPVTVDQCTSTSHLASVLPNGARPARQTYMDLTQNTQANKAHANRQTVKSCQKKSPYRHPEDVQWTILSAKC